MRLKWVIVEREEYENLKKDLYESQCNAEGILKLALFSAAGLKERIRKLEEENEILKNERNEIY